MLSGIGFAKLSIASSAVQSLWRFQVWAFCLGCAEGWVICLTRGFHGHVAIALVPPSNPAELLESPCSLPALASVLPDANVAPINLSPGVCVVGAAAVGFVGAGEAAAQSSAAVAQNSPLRLCITCTKPCGYFSKQGFLGWFCF